MHIGVVALAGVKIRLADSYWNLIHLKPAVVVLRVCLSILYAAALFCTRVAEAAKLSACKAAAVYSPLVYCLVAPSARLHFLLTTMQRARITSVRKRRLPREQRLRA